MSLRILSQKIRKDRKFFLRCHLACRAFPASLPDADTSAPHNAGKTSRNTEQLPLPFLEPSEDHLPHRFHAGFPPPPALCEVVLRFYFLFIGFIY